MSESVSSPSRYRWVILGVCWLAYVVAFMQRLSIGPLAPFLKEDLSLSGTQVGMLMSAAAFGYMLTLLPAGWLADRIGVRWLLLSGEIIGGIFIISMFTVTTFTSGLIFMGLAGFGMGFLMPSTTKAVLEWFPVKERATVMGLKQTAVNIGGIITATALPTVALTFGWKFGFLGIGLVAVIIGIVSFFLYKQPAQVSRKEKIVADAPRPLVRDVFASRDIWMLIAAGICLAVVEFSAIAYFVLYLNESLLIPLVTAGFFLAILEGGGVFGKPLTGLISDRIFGGSRKKVYLLMCLTTVILCLVFAFLRQGTPDWLLVALSAILGFMAVGWGGLHLTLIGEFAGRESAGIVSGASSMFIMIGIMAGPPLFGYIFDATASYRFAWYFLVAVAVLSVVFLLFVRESRRRI